jgi:hypothetical protein
MASVAVSWSTSVGSMMHDLPSSRPAEPANDRGSGLDPEPDRDSERLIDAALADSFPASDPPPWTLGIGVRRHSQPQPLPARSARTRSSTGGCEWFTKT